MDLRTRDCGSARHNTRRLMGPAILVTLGALFLLDQQGIISFDITWPVLLIVIGVLVFATHRAPAEHEGRASSIDESDSGANHPGQAGAGPQVKL
jgi:Domain of unknown function (DUF5668)